MTRDEAKKVIEVLLFVSEKPVAADRLSQVIDGFDKGAVRGIIEELNREYAAAKRSFGIVEVAGGFQMMTDAFYAPWIRRLFAKDKKQKLSRPSLETLAIIAYRQPITRADIEAIRGVNIEGVLETLFDRDLIKVAGRKDVVGRPFLYGTTKNFLAHFGLNSLQDLPKLRDFSEEDIHLGSDELIKKESEDRDEQRAESPQEAAREN